MSLSATRRCRTVFSKSYAGEIACVFAFVVCVLLVNLPNEQLAYRFPVAGLSSSALPRRSLQPAPLTLAPPEKEGDSLIERGQDVGAAVVVVTGSSQNGSSSSSSSSSGSSSSSSSIIDDDPLIDPVPVIVNVPVNAGGTIQHVHNQPQPHGTPSSSSDGEVAIAVAISPPEVQNRYPGAATGDADHAAQQIDGGHASEPLLTLLNSPAPNDNPALQTLNPVGLPTPNPGALRFFSIGDQGTGSAAQRNVSRMMRDVLPDYRGAFMLGLGDNFYVSGVRSVTDPQWVQKFESQYPPALGPIPFHPTIGDHDHCWNATALVAYTPLSNNWRLPSFYYTLEHEIPSGGNVQIIVTDSVGLEGAFSEGPLDRRFGALYNMDVVGKEAGLKQVLWLEELLKRPKAHTWRIVVGHRPVVSGSQRFGRDGREFAAEARFRQYMRSLLSAHQVDVYMNGHDHTTQWICEGGVSFLINGVGGYDLHALEKTPPPGTIYQNNTFFGFAIHQLFTETMEVSFVDRAGQRRQTLQIPRHGECTALIDQALVEEL